MGCGNYKLHTVASDDCKRCMFCGYVPEFVWVREYCEGYFTGEIRHMCEDVGRSYIVINARSVGKTEQDAYEEAVRIWNRRAV